MFCCCTVEDDDAVIIDTPVALAGNHTKESGEDVKADGLQLQETPAKQLGPADPQAQAPAAKRDAEVLGEETSFVAVLRRQEAEEALGMGVDFADRKVLHVCQLLAEGINPISRYNASAPRRQIRNGDYIVSINGLSYETVLSPEKILDMLRLSSVEVAIRRPHLFECQVDRQGQAMGLELIYCDSGASLIITGVSAGAVQSTAPEVVMGDRIVSVNGVEGGPQVLLHAIQEANGPMTLRISRLLAPA